MDNNLPPLSAANIHLSLAEFLPYKLAKLSHQISDSLAKQYQQQFGLSVPEWRILVHVADMAARTTSYVSGKQITQAASLDKSTASRAVQSLVKKAYLIKHSDPADKRSALLSLTIEGERLVQTIMPLAIDWQQALLQELSSKQLEDFNQVLDILSRKLNDI